MNKNEYKILRPVYEKIIEWADISGVNRSEENKKFEELMKTLKTANEKLKKGGDEIR